MHCNVVTLNTHVTSLFSNTKCLGKKQSFTTKVSWIGDPLLTQNWPYWQEYLKYWPPKLELDPVQYKTAYKLEDALNLRKSSIHVFTYSCIQHHQDNSGFVDQ